MRVKVELELIKEEKNRITPAGAGKRQYVGIHSYRHMGSPPQVRVKEKSTLVMTSAIRITPAGAGKRKLNLHLQVLSKDHPRRCG